VVPSSVVCNSFIPPAPEQISSSACGLTIGEAIADAIDMANHTSTKRARSLAWRSSCRVDIGRIVVAVFQPEGSASCLTVIKVCID
jgi:hypothetical protein